MAESRYIRLTDYCLIEYIFASDGTPTTSALFHVLYNKDSGVHQMYNSNADLVATKNIQDHTAIPIGNNKYVYNDQEKVPNYIDYDENIVHSVLNSGAVLPFVYDTVRFHFMSGFTFDEFQALILTVKNKENVGVFNIFTSLLLTVETADTLMRFNHRPIFLTDTLYDRYIEVRVPAIKKLNSDYYSSTGITQANTLAAKLTPNSDSNGYIGFIENAPINFAIDECNRVDKLETDNTVYDIYITENHKESVLPQVSEYDLLGAQIYESINGDYIEYFATYDGGFVADFIGRLTARNPHDRWVVVHQFNIYEQVGASHINTNKAIFYQEDNFDEAQKYRPVLKHADEALSFSIDYTLRLLNQRDGNQIIRTASFSSLNPAKYGEYMVKLPLSGTPQSHKVYNKLIKKSIEASHLFTEPSLEEHEKAFVSASDFTGNIIKNVYIPIFFNFNRINISQKNLSITQEDKFVDLVYRQGDLHIMLTPFDNIIKFKVYELSNNEIVPMNLNFSSDFNIVFMNDSKKIKFQNMRDSSKENLEEGEIVFKIPQKDSEVILNSTDREFYITIVGSDNTETVLYNGFWNTVNEKDIVDENNRKVKEEQSVEEETVEKITELENALTDQAQEIQAIGASEKAVPFVSEDVSAENVSIINVDIPGYVKRASSGAEVSVFKKKKPILSRRNVTARTNVAEIATKSLKTQLG